MIKNTLSEEDINYYSSVVVLCAGGTINMSGTTECKPANGVFYVLTKKLDPILKSMDIPYVYVPIFDRAPDSSNIGDAEWEKIIQIISDVIAKKERIGKALIQNGIRKEVGGIVIAHGTDTLHLTSLVVALEFSVKHLQIPIIFTASHSTVDAPGTDAVGNLLKSIYVAKERFDRAENLIPGVYALIGQDIHLASRLTKVYTTPNDDGKYFYSFPSPVGQITGAKSDDFHFKIDNNFLLGLIKSEYKSSDKLSRNLPWGVVEHIFLDKFVSPDILNDLETRLNLYREQASECPELKGRRLGLVIQGNFKNNDNFEEMTSILHSIDKENVIIFIGSKDTFTALNAYGKWNNLCLIPKSLSHLKAAIKLRWLLRYDMTLSRVAELMDTNIAGEIFNTDILPEWIKFETFPNYAENTEVILAYPNIHPAVLYDAVKRLDLYNPDNNKDSFYPEKYTKKLLYIYGFGDGNYPTSNTSIAQLVNDFTYKYWGRSADINKNATLKNILDKLNKYVYENRYSIVTYFENNYNLIPSHRQKKLFAKYIRAELKNTKKAEMQHNIPEIFNSLSEEQITVSIPKEKLSQIVNYTTERIKITVDSKYIETQINRLLNNGSDISEFRNVFFRLSENFPDVISKRIMKEAVMSANDNMKAIGTAVDKHIKVYAKTLAVKSKSNIAKYEAGNMLMVLGVDSDTTLGYQTEFFYPKKL